MQKVGNSLVKYVIIKLGKISIELKKVKAIIS